MQKKFFLLIFSLFISILLNIKLINAQLQTNAPWPMFHQNLKHTGITNKNILGVQNNPNIKWTFKADGIINSSPAISPDGTIYFGTSNGTLYAVTNGKLKWLNNISPGTSINSSPAIGKDGTIYFGCQNTDIYALTNGNIKWSYNSTQWIDWASPVIDTNGVVYIGNGYFILYAMTNGNYKWNITLIGNQINTSPALGNDGTIYVGVGDTDLNESRLFARNISDGTPKWALNNLGFILSSPAIDKDNTVYIGTGVSTCKLYAVTNGAVKWSFTAGSNIYSSPAIDDNNVIYFGCQDKYLYAVTNEFLKWKFLTSDYIDLSSPVIGKDNTIYIGNMSGDFYAVNPNSTKKWHISLGGQIQGTAAIGSDGTIYIGTSTSNLYAIGEGESSSTNGTGDDNASSLNQDLNNVIIAPNPFKPNLPGSADYVTFYNLTQDAEIKIFTVTGRLIVTLKKINNDNKYTWNVRDKNNRLLPSGVYICYITNSKNQKKHLKLIIIR